jgi:hypothetical protein
MCCCSYNRSPRRISRWIISRVGVALLVALRPQVGRWEQLSHLRMPSPIPHRDVDARLFAVRQTAACCCTRPGVFFVLCFGVTQPLLKVGWLLCWQCSVPLQCIPANSALHCCTRLGVFLLLCSGVIQLLLMVGWLLCWQCSAFPQPLRCTAAQGSANTFLLCPGVIRSPYEVGSVLAVQCRQSLTALHFCTRLSEFMVLGWCDSTSVKVG